MTTLLYLDLATKTGWAVGDITGRPSFGTWEIKTPANMIGEFIHRHGAEIGKKVFEANPDWIAFEKPFARNLKTASKLIGLGNKAEEVAYMCGIKCSMTEYWDVMQWSHGKRSQKGKEPVFDAARERGHEVTNFDEADAVMGWEYTAHELWTAETPHLKSFKELNEPALEGIK